MKSKQEIRDWLLENCVDEYGNLELIGLNFGDFNGNIYISAWTVKNDLFQGEHKVGGSLYQNFQTVVGEIQQCHQTSNGSLYQGRQKVRGDLYQNCQKVEKHLFQEYQTVGKILHQYQQTVGGSIHTHKPKNDEIMEDTEFEYFRVKKINDQKIKPISKEKLKEMGYILMEE